MDGNGRWAAARGKNRLYGHRRGKTSVREVIDTALDVGIENMTLFAFSTENWARPAREVDALMRLLRNYLKTELARLMRHGIRVQAIGNLRRLPPDVLAELRSVERRTEANTAMTVRLALSYGGREDIVAAARHLARQVRDGRLKPERIDEERFAGALMTAGVPEPDLLIRTSGEMRISNFLLWDLAYTEIYVTETLWPDFRREQFMAALEHYKRRSRRFGRTASQLERSA